MTLIVRVGPNTFGFDRAVQLDRLINHLLFENLFDYTQLFVFLSSAFTDESPHLYASHNLSLTSYIRMRRHSNGRAPACCYKLRIGDQLCPFNAYLISYVISHAISSSAIFTKKLSSKLFSGLRQIIAYSLCDM